MTKYLPDNKESRLWFLKNQRLGKYYSDDKISVPRQPQIDSTENQVEKHKKSVIPGRLRIFTQRLHRSAFGFRNMPGYNRILLRAPPFTTINGSMSLSFLITSDSSPRRQVPP